LEVHIPGNRRFHVIGHQTADQVFNTQNTNQFLAFLSGGAGDTPLPEKLDYIFHHHFGSNVWTLRVMTSRIFSS